MSDPKKNDPQISTFNSEERGSRRGPELMKSEKQKEEEKQEEKQDDVREKTLDKTLADSFPTSDPPSSIPDPSEDEFEDKQASSALWRGRPRPCTKGHSRIDCRQLPRVRRY